MIQLALRTKLSS